MVVESEPPEVSILAARASRKSSIWSPVLVFVPPVRQTSAINGHHAGLVGRRVDGPAANLGDRGDQRQLVIRLQEDHHAIRQLNANRLLAA